tara:strand:+ start:1107 stop:1517 length:411 start_codon:yes stop_codon:yes gene_type:complete
MFSLKHLILFNVPYFFMMVLTQVGMLGVDVQELNDIGASKYLSYTSDGSVTEMVTFNNAETKDGAGMSWGDLKTPFQFAKLSADKLGDFINMATLDHNFFKVNQFTESIRLLLLAGTIPLIMSIALKGMEVIGNFF